MKLNEIPKYIIKRNMQKSKHTGRYFDQIITHPTLGLICNELFGTDDFECEFVDNKYQDDFLDATYNQGRLAILHYKETVTYISFSDELGDGRNKAFQSVPTAFNRFYTNSYKKKKLYFCFLNCDGNDATPYFIFTYRLMKTAGFNFINVPQYLQGKIKAFSTIDDIIRARKENGGRNPANNATHIVRTGPHEIEIYGKTYGANKYETSLICYAISKLATKQDNITLYEYNEKDLKELPGPSLSVIRSMGNINIVNIDDEIEKKELDANDSLRSPRFNARLLDRLGERHCVLCDCEISEIIQGAHIWPVADIKKTSGLSDDEKLAYATDGQNGLWMCQNHHKMFDTNIIRLSKEGKISYQSEIGDKDKKYIASITPVLKLPKKLITDDFKNYIGKRYKTL